MYQKVMVPLDGSALAECVLPHLRAVAKGCNAASVVLVRVIEPFPLPPGTAFTVTAEVQDRLEKDLQLEAETYLKRVAGNLAREGIAVKWELLYGLPAEKLADYARANNVDLIVIATHGRSGVSRWVWGSVADRLLRSANIPVLVVRVPGCPAPE